jgi:hypothetical protein
MLDRNVVLRELPLKYELRPRHSRFCWLLLVVPQLEPYILDSNNGGRSVWQPHASYSRQIRLVASPFPTTVSQVQEYSRSCPLATAVHLSWQPLLGEWHTTFTIITTAANQLLEPIHNRMSVILDEAGAADWMNLREPDPLSLKRLLVPTSDDLLVVRPDSPLVNSVKNERPELLEDLWLLGQ